MNKNLKYYLIICLIIISFNSCNVLDEEPFTQLSTENFYQNESDALAALTSVYARLKSGNGYYKQGFTSTLFASSDQGLLGSRLFFNQSIVLSVSMSVI